MAWNSSFVVASLLPTKMEKSVSLKSSNFKMRLSSIVWENLLWFGTASTATINTIQKKWRLSLDMIQQYFTVKKNNICCWNKWLQSLNYFRLWCSFSMIPGFSEMSSQVWRQSRKFQERFVAKYTSKIVGERREQAKRSEHNKSTFCYEENQSHDSLPCFISRRSQTCGHVKLFWMNISENTRTCRRWCRIEINHRIQRG